MLGLLQARLFVCWSAVAATIERITGAKSHVLGVGISTGRLWASSCLSWIFYRSNQGGRDGWLCIIARWPNILAKDLAGRLSGNSRCRNDPATVSTLSLYYILGRGTEHTVYQVLQVLVHLSWDHCSDSLGGWG